jgi:hypothetical protein
MLLELLHLLLCNRCEFLTNRFQITSKSLRNRYTPLCNRCAIAFKFFYNHNRFATALKSLFERFAIALEEIHDRCAITLQSSQNRFAWLRNRFTTGAQSL